MIPRSNDKASVDHAMQQQLFQPWNQESELKPMDKKNLSFQAVELQAAQDITKVVMEDILFQWQNMELNLDSILNNVNLIKIMIYLVNMNVLKKKCGRLMNMDMLDKAIMEARMNQLCSKKS